MDQLITDFVNLIPVKYRPVALALGVLLPRGLYALKNGGGFKEFLCAMFLGTNTPQPQNFPQGPGAPTPGGPAAPAQSQPGKIPLMALAFAAALSLSLSACSTNQQTAVYKSATAVQTSVETVMTAWGNFVASGHATDAQRAQVAQAYNKYQLAMVTLIDAEVAFGTISAGSDTNAVVSAQGQNAAASAAANQALSDLVALVQSFGVKF